MSFSVHLVRVSTGLLSRALLPVRISQLQAKQELKYQGAKADMVITALLPQML